MKFAVVGTDENILLLVKAAQETNHQIVAYDDVRPSDEEPFAKLMHKGELSRDWTELIAASDVDAILVGQGTLSAEASNERMKQLAESHIPLLVSYPVGESILGCYEVDMIRTESSSLIQFFHPALEIIEQTELKKWVSTGHPTLGFFTQADLESFSGATTREEVLQNFSVGANIVMRLFADVARVNAVSATETVESITGLQVQMTGAAKIPVRWSLDTHHPTAGGRFRVTAERGRIEFYWQQVAETFQIEFTEDKASKKYEVRLEDLATTVLSRFVEAALSSETMSSETPQSSASIQSSAASRGDLNSWKEVVQAMEVVDAAELSLHKGRAISVIHQELTEELAFKGKMAGYGCGVLMVVLAIPFVVGFLESGQSKTLSAGNGKGLLAMWPHFMLICLTLFLALQLLPFLVPSRSKDKK